MWSYSQTHIENPMS
ncbi:hypothetical protein F383_35239 [Gossypium arboreum]|uniref:Uncharacterized protein n=1 Tax=Gossypium arboreum TaxID=29729 RepID=A0A0B0PUH9_GOSAR|nr:hypothetical protein F383_35239 [Gossypium arboreum]